MKTVELQITPSMLKKFFWGSDKESSGVSDVIGLHWRSAIRALFMDQNVKVLDVKDTRNKTFIKKRFPIPKKFKLKLVLEVQE